MDNSQKEFYRDLIKSLVTNEVALTKVEHKVKEINGSFITEWKIAKDANGGKAIDFREALIKVIRRAREEEGLVVLETEKEEELYAMFDELVSIEDTYKHTLDLAGIR